MEGRITTWALSGSGRRHLALTRTGPDIGEIVKTPSGFHLQAVEVAITCVIVVSKVGVNEFEAVPCR